MKGRFLLAALLACWSFEARAQSVLFDFDTAPYGAPLPIDLTVEGITARLSANPVYNNYSVQAANVLGFTPNGFAGLCISPSTIYPCDLLIAFDRSLTGTSIMYAPEEYATDSSCTMRMTAYYDSRFVATITYTLPNNLAGTWPTGVLALTASEPFNNVVIHYERQPVTGGDWGPIFMADNLVVTPWSAPYVRVDSARKDAYNQMLLVGVSVPFATITVETLDDLFQTSGSLNPVVCAGDGRFQFGDPATDVSKRFYRVRYP